MTSGDLLLACSCGQVSGLVSGASPSTGTHAVCYCDDCQAFARHLGHPERVLDANGGTEVFQTSSGRVSFSKGRENVACIRLSPKGILRWHTTCCATPIGNTPTTPGLPFVGLILSCVGNAVDGTAREEIVGPIRGWAFQKFATGDKSVLEGRPENLPALVMRFIRVMAVARFRGDHRRSAFFEPDGKAPIAVPRTLSDEERASAYRRPA